jgi:LmbE family N-acetylglucosaminyl deacetylase
MYAADILLLCPHPDDEIVGAAGAIQRAVAAGCRVHVAWLTTGVPSRGTLWPWQRRRHAALVARRRRESDTAGDLFGYVTAFRQSVPTRNLRHAMGMSLSRIEAAIERLGIATVWCPAYEGGHQDHDVACFLASRLSGHIPVWEFAEYNFAGGHVRSQEFIRPTGFEMVLRLTPAEISLKRRGLATYRSERGNLGYVDWQRECFRPLAPYRFAAPPHSGRTFYQRFQWAPPHPRIDRCRPEEVCTSFRAFDPALDETRRVA